MIFFLWALKMKTTDFLDEKESRYHDKEALLQCYIRKPIQLNFIKMLNFFVNCLRLFRFLTSFFYSQKFTVQVGLALSQVRESFDDFYDKKF